MTYLALGDSYTIGEAVEQKDSFPFLLAEKLNIKQPEIIAKTGWTTGDLIKGIFQTNTSPSYDLVTLCIGVNNQYQGKSRTQYKEELTQLFKYISSKSPKQIICVSIPNYGCTPFGRSSLSYISSDLNWYNLFFKELCLKNGGTWIDIDILSSSALGNLELLAEDNLHPSGKMYQKIVNQIVDEL